MIHFEIENLFCIVQLRYKSVIDQRSFLSWRGFFFKTIDIKNPSKLRLN